MRLLTVFLILSITYGKTHRGLEFANDNNGPELETLLGQSPDEMPKDHPENHVPFGDVYREGFQPRRIASFNTENDTESLLDKFRMGGFLTTPRYYPVPFGHIFKEGFDPLKRDPLDLLELSSFYVKDDPVIRQLESKKMALPIRKPKTFLSPKDEFYVPPKQKKGNNQTKEEVFIFDFVGQQLRNVKDNPRNRNPSLGELIAQRAKTKVKKSNSTKDSLNKHFDSDKNIPILVNDISQLERLIKNQKKDNITWTTCKEFGKKADFHPKDIVDLEWIPFYIWSYSPHTMERAIAHIFTYPTIKLVNYYKETLGPHLNKSVDWEQPKLLLKESMETLLIAVGRRGLFDAIPNNKLPEQITSKIIVPQLQIRLKIVDPYLAMMICDEKYAVIMANPGNEPTTIEDKIAEAKTLKFKGTGKPVVRDLRLEMWVAQKQKKHEIERKKKMKPENSFQAPIEVL